VGKMRNIFSTWINKCPFCLKAGSVERSFSHAAEDPRILSLLEVECPVFHCISLDLFTEVFVLSHGRARGKPSYPVNILIVADLISKSVVFVVLDGSKTVDVVKGIQQIGLRFRLPEIIILDAGPQLRNLPDHTELTQALSLKEIKVISVPQGHQFSSHSERMIQEAKKVLLSLREDPNSSIYRQPQTLLELLGKLSLVESVLSLRPILGHTKDQRETVLTPRRLTHPYMSGEALNQSVVDILRGVFEPSDIVSQLGRHNHENKLWLQSSLLDYLQDSGVRYAKERSGNDQKRCHNTLKPAQNDIVMYNDSEKKKRFGIIIEILIKNQVMLRSVLYGKVVTRKFHIRLLVLLYRPSEWNHDIPI
jgi:hypothetical protein